MLNNRVRFGNMKRVNRAVWALTVILMMVLGLVLAGCSGSSDGADGKEESTYSKIVAIAKKGRSLADVKDELKEVVPEKLRTLDRGRPWRDSQFASTRLSPSRDMSR